MSGWGREACRQAGAVNISDLVGRQRTPLAQHRQLFLPKSAHLDVAAAQTPPPSHHLHGRAIARQGGVRGEEGKALDLGLGDEDPVEGIFVERGQIGQGEGVGAS